MRIQVKLFLLDITSVTVLNRVGWSRNCAVVELLSTAIPIIYKQSYRSVAMTRACVAFQAMRQRSTIYFLITSCLPIRRTTANTNSGTSVTTRPWWRHKNTSCHTALTFTSLRCRRRGQISAVTRPSKYTLFTRTAITAYQSGGAIERFVSSLLHGLPVFGPDDEKII